MSIPFQLSLLVGGYLNLSLVWWCLTLPYLWYILYWICLGWFWSILFLMIRFFEDLQVHWKNERANACNSFIFKKRRYIPSKGGYSSKSIIFCCFSCFYLLGKHKFFLFEYCTEMHFDIVSIFIYMYKKRKS